MGGTNLKKLLVLSLFMMLAFVALVGCSSNKEEVSGSKKQTIRVLSSDDFAGFREEAIKEFNKENPDIEVILEHVAYDQLHDKELASFNAGGSAAYDIVDVDEIWTSEYAEAGFILPVTDRYTEEMKSGILPASLNIVSYQDDYYGVPMFNDVLFFYYNEDLLKQAGYNEPPKTWDEFTEMSKALQDQNLVTGNASTWGWSSNEGLVCYYAGFLGSFGGSFFDKNGKPVFNNEAGVKALQYMTDAMNKEKIVDPASINANDREILDSFMNGKTAFVSGWSFYWGEINGDASQVKGKAKVGLLPSVSGAPHATATGSMYLAITPQSKNQDAAWKFIEFLGSKEMQKQQSLKAGALPIWKDLYQDAELNENHGALEAMGKQLEETISRPSLEAYNEFSKVLQVKLQEALLEKQDAKTALDEAAKAAEELIGSN
jgi:multiple sugar transport system substrate-binding protein